MDQTFGEAEIVSLTWLKEEELAYKKVNKIIFRNVFYQLPAYIEYKQQQEMSKTHTS